MLQRPCLTCCCLLLQHRGFALVVVHHPDEAPAAAQAILGTPLGPEPLLAQPALKAPEEWPAEYTCGWGRVVGNSAAEYGTHVGGVVVVGLLLLRTAAADMRQT